MPIDWLEQSRVRAIVRKLEKNQQNAEYRISGQKQFARKCRRSDLRRLVTWENGKTTLTRNTVAVWHDGQYVDPNDGVPVGGWL